MKKNKNKIFRFRVWFRHQNQWLTIEIRCLSKFCFDSIQFSSKFWMQLKTNKHEWNGFWNVKVLIWYYFFFFWIFDSIYFQFIVPFIMKMLNFEDNFLRWLWFENNRFHIQSTSPPPPPPSSAYSLFSSLNYFFHSISKWESK